MCRISHQYLRNGAILSAKSVLLATYPRDKLTPKISSVPQELQDPSFETHVKMFFQFSFKMVKGTILLTKESRRVEKLRLKDVKFHPHTLKVFVFCVHLAL